MKSTRHSQRSGNEFCPTENGFRIDFKIGCPFCKKNNFRISIFDHLFRYHLNRQYLTKDICDDLNVEEDLLENIMHTKLINQRDRSQLLEKLSQSILPTDLATLYHCSRCFLQVSNPQQLRNHVRLFEHFPQSDGSSYTGSHSGNEEQILESIETTSYTDTDGPQFTTESESTTKESDFDVDFEEEMSEQLENSQDSANSTDSHDTMNEENRLEYYDNLQKHAKMKVKEITGYHNQVNYHNSQVMALKMREEFFERFEQWNIPKFQNKFEIDEDKEIEWLDGNRTLRKIYGTAKCVNTQDKNKSQIVKIGLKKWNIIKCQNDKYGVDHSREIEYLDEEGTLSKQYIHIQTTSRRDKQISLSPRRSKFEAEQSYNFRKKQQVQQAAKKREKKKKQNKKQAAKNKHKNKSDEDSNSEQTREKAYHYCNCCLKCFRKFRFQDKFSTHDKNYCVTRQPQEPKCRVWNIQDDHHIPIKHKKQFLTYFDLTAL